MNWEVFVDLADDIKKHLIKQKYSHFHDVYTDEVGNYVLNVVTKDSVLIKVLYVNQTKEFRIGLIRHRYITDESIWNESLAICELSKKMLEKLIENDPACKMQKLFHPSELISDYYTNVLTKKKKELTIR